MSAYVYFLCAFFFRLETTMIAQIKRWCAHPNMRPDGSKKTKVVGIKEELFSEKLRTRVRRIIKTVFGFKKKSN